ncbi:MAG: phosphate--acyl-ACP acyltransferase, partial [Chitinophagaceae bacterium]
MNIGLDMMGGDFAPQEAVKGAMQYLQEENTEATLFLIGNNNQIETLLIPYPVAVGRINVVHAEQVIDMHEHPTKA